MNRIVLTIAIVDGSGLVKIFRQISGTKNIWYSFSVLGHCEFKLPVGQKSSDRNLLRCYLIKTHYFHEKKPVIIIASGILLLLSTKRTTFVSSQYHFESPDDFNYHRDINSQKEKIGISTTTIEVKSLTNIYLKWNCKSPEYGGDVEKPQEDLILSFGTCDSYNIQNNVRGTAEINYHRIGRINTITSSSSSVVLEPSQQQCHYQRRFLWAVPSLETLDMDQGCFFAIREHSHKIYAKSKSYSVSPSKKLPVKVEQQGKSQEESDIYFDGVTYFKNMMAKKQHFSKKQPMDDFMEVDPVSAKNEKKIGVIGAGASGLFSAYLLKQAGYKNIEIMEGSDRVGGRIKTAYFDSTKTVYNELGAMRIPISWSYQNQTIPIHQHNVIFQIARELNAINNEEDKIEFIPFINTGENNLEYFNGFRLPDGRVPTKKEMSELANFPYFRPGVPIDISREAHDIIQPFSNDGIYKSLAENFYGTFKNEILTFWDEWSQREWLHLKMNASKSAVDYANDRVGEIDIWNYIYSSLFMRKASKFRTIYGGMSRLPEALLLALGNEKIISYNIPISKIEFMDHEDGRNSTLSRDKSISVQWKNKPFDEAFESKEFDNVIVSVPFTIVRSWRLPRELPYTLKSAIKYLENGSACKVLLEFKTRFWERYQGRPIFGGCDNTDLSLGTTCYPSHGIGSEGPAVMIASYTIGDDSQFGSLGDEEHVARILEDIVEMHGAIAREQYTGKYARHCWAHDPFARLSWPYYTAAHRKLYTPSYYEYLDGLVFVGEHTHIYQDWVSSALHSAIRGVIMILIEDGDIDGAKAIANHWNDTSYVHI
ncbi:hypothetical protein BDA99DRAFT_576757 [Phascolomyces articulosus]|uniref:Amine oxidase domain-containing protein n=1 Tax=Phascolomyces articulosus TaxID=60185 RepID=A0AAD5P991_9FUNG|nr:hypothetical protein BDA99DRAFT_576757 [Phascolomyces articulosus]